MKYLSPRLWISLCCLFNIKKHFTIGTTCLSTRRTVEPLPIRTTGKQWLACALALFLSIFAVPAMAADIDVQVSSYNLFPDPVINGGAVTFTLTVQNNGPDPSAASTLTITPPDNVTYASNGSGCTFGGTGLTCPIAPLALGASATVTYTATGSGAGVESTTASLVENAADTDSNVDNNTQIKNITSINGADLSVTQAGPGGCTNDCTTAAGSTIDYTLTVSNAGPDPATTFQVVDDLPATVDFIYQSASGTNWSCGHGVTTLTCDYSGPPIASGSDTPPITVTGQVVTSAGTITTGASVTSTDTATDDPDETNNGPDLLVVSVTPGTNLRANKTMVSAATGLTSLVPGETATLTLSATNTGTQQATGVTLTDSVPSDFSIDSFPGTCSAVGQDITCSVGTLNAGATSSAFVIPLTVTGSSGASGTNIANVTRTAPAGTDTPANIGYSIVEPFSRLTITKSKTPEDNFSPGSNDPVKTGRNIVNTVVVTNSSSSTSAATGTVTVEERLNHPAETFDALTGASSAAGWVCGAPGTTVTCSFNITGSLARGASLPALAFTTTAVGSNMDLSNEACTGGDISAHSPADSDLVPECSGAQTLYSAAPDTDIGITKTVGDSDIAIGDASFTYTIGVTNHGDDRAPTIVVTDVIPMYYDGPAGTTTVTPTLDVMNAGESCSAIAGTVICTIKNLDPAQTRNITILVERPVLDGANITNTASWDSPDTVQSVNVEPDSASIDVNIDPIADVTVTSIADAPDPVKVGVSLTYTTSIKNNGPSTAAGVELYHTIDPLKMAYVDGSASLTGDGSCTEVADFVTGPYAAGTTGGIKCTGFALSNDEARQLTFSVIPIFPYPDALDATYVSDAAITTTTPESDAGNNSLANTANVTSDQLDLSVTKQEALGYDPDDAGPLSNLLHDPVAFGDQIKYLVTLRNNGPSLATALVVTDTLTPPGIWTSTYIGASHDTGNSNYTPGNGISCSVTGGASPGTNASPQTLTCYLGTGAGDSILPSGKYVTLELTFATGGSDPSGSLTYSNRATVASAETGGSPYAGDTLPGNNTISENTTVLPKTDLYLTKTADSGVDTDGSPYNINETFNYILTVGNKGPSTAAGVRITDALPSGIVPTGNVSVSVGGNVTLATNTCAGSPWSGSCDIGPLPFDASGANPADQVVITIPVKAAHPYAGAIDTDITNTATIAPIDGTSIDSVADNNSGSADVQIRANSIAGTVYADNDQDDVIDAGEGIDSVRLDLSGTDSYGNTITVSNKQTAGGGLFTFDRLPPGTYQIVETQPSGYWDRFETVGSAGGTNPEDTCDGTINCAATSLQNTVSGINLLPKSSSTDATGYIFQELPRARLLGYVYHDADNNGDRGSESGIASLVSHVTLSGTAYNGVDVQTLITETLSLNSNGRYYYSNLPPSDGTGYTLQQNSQPVGYFDGKEQTGNGTGNVVATSEDRQPLGVAANSDSETIASIVLTPSLFRTEYNFGELLPATLSGFVFIDSDGDAEKDAGETVGVPGVSVALAGTDYLGTTVAVTATTDGSGAYSFTGLLPGTYSLTETPPAGLSHTGAEAGSEGGTGGAGSGVVAITAIPLSSGDTATGYNFGERGQGLSGFVYVDDNGNGVKDGAEPGISGVAITVSGNALAGGSVCDYIASCTIASDGTGQYSFPDLPSSDASGYTLTEQSQTSLPLSGYGDGTDVVGSGITIAGTATNDVISGIGLVLGEFGVGYNFGEHVGSLSGAVYFDSDDDGVKDVGESGIDGISVTLSGYTWGSNGSDDSGGGDDVVIADITTTTAGGGNYSFAGLLRGTYTITETHPDDWGDGKETPGSNGGTAANTGFNNSPVNNRISAIALPAGSNATDYLFGERSSGLSGRVCEDTNDDGVCQAGEIGIAGTTITLSGTTTVDGDDVCTFIAPASCTVTTAADGSYSFPELPAGTYTLTQAHPTIYLDGKENSGNPSGTVDISGFDTSVGRNSISAIPLPGGQSGTLFDFGERPLTDATLSGHVWLDENHDRVRDAGEPLYADWTIQLWQSGTLIQSTTTDGAGFYSMSVTPNTDYELRFVHPSASVIFGSAVPNETATAYVINNMSAGNPAGGDNSSGILTGLTLISGANVPEQSLPLDPSGVVYDSITRNPVAGAVVTISGPATFDPAIHLLGGTTNANQTTGSDGFYQFLLLPGAPANETYTLTVTPPAGYVPTPSTIIPVCENTPTVGAIPDPALVQTSVAPPLASASLHDAASCPNVSSGFAGSANSTQYFASFDLNPGVSGEVVNNHFPVDPVLGGAIILTKTTPLVNVTIGQLVPYTITAINTLAAPLSNIDLRDILPPGFKYKKGSASLDGMEATPAANGRVLSWTDLNIPANGTRTLKMLLVVGAGVQPGEFINSVQAFNNLVPAPDNAVSNRATATVRVVPDPLFDCSDVIGKVFDDLNADGYQNDGEPPIPNVRLATVRGLLVTTDAEGRFHITCAMVPNEMRGSNFIMKLDERTLPTGYRLTTENPRTILLTRGKMGKLNFGATIHRVIRLDMNAAAFVAGQPDPGTELSQALESLLEQLRSAPSVIRLAYRQQAETDGLIKKRLEKVRKFIEDLWDEQGCCYDLVFEEEVFQRDLQDNGGAK